MLEGEVEEDSRDNSEERNDEAYAKTITTVDGSPVLQNEGT